MAFPIARAGHTASEVPLASPAALHGTQVAETLPPNIVELMKGENLDPPPHQILHTLAAWLPRPVGCAKMLQLEWQGGGEAQAGRQAAGQESWRDILMFS